MLKIHSYVLDHDLGLAPNPFWGYCTLAVCKPIIRKTKELQIGDWVIGTGSKKLFNFFGKECLSKLVFAMELNEKLSFQEYWEDQRFKDKKPMMKGSLIKAFGDNIYYKINNENWHQLDSAHSNIDGSSNLIHLKNDLSGNNVLISSNFFYFGENAPNLPLEFQHFSKKGPGHKKIINENEIQSFLKWLNLYFQKGINGNPTNWKIYDQTNFLDKLF